MKSSFVLISLMFLSGCASVPKSVDELRAAGKAKSSFCSNKPFNETVELIERQVKKCFAHGKQDIYGGTSDTFIEKIEADSNSITLASVAHVNWNRFYQIIVDVSSQDKCPAFVEAYGMSSNWSKTTGLVQDWISGNNLDKCD
ncbi:hypothetical protein [Shewanella mangrovisoli]|uniref:hypothetical protein n=1 Tax=Shewanella mangrovisoli TaxID=2864211 RepID=UPI001C6618AC|nr:hypothetical protein [Shewanella mangrovisoli]QYK07553.1 hypothetical protein K0H60_11945 [Shewanella mangrovisoli]